MEITIQVLIRSWNETFPNFSENGDELIYMMKQTVVDVTDSTWIARARSERDFVLAIMDDIFVCPSDDALDASEVDSETRAFCTEFHFAQLSWDENHGQKRRLSVAW